MNNTQNSNSDMSAEPRICMFSQRNLGKLVSRCGHYEFEDVVCEVDNVELLTPDPYRYFTMGQKVANRFAQHIRVASINPGVRKLRLNRNYDLFLAVFQFPKDLFSINAVEGWRQRCRTSVCWVDDVWAGELHKLAGHLKLMSKFDYVMLNCSASVKPVQDMIRRPCFYMLPGTDTIRFSPYPDPPHRCIDVYNLGRKSPVTHRFLLKMAEQKQFFYIYDTIHKMDTFYPRQHRSLMANIAKRSRYFIANIAKLDRQSETHGQIEIGFRFFEGAAAGAVIIGEPPENEAFRKHFNWPDAVIRVPFNAPNIAEIIADLDSQPARLGEIRKNNIVQSLLRHDWVYRWERILDIVGLKPKPALVARKKHLKELAKMANTP